MVLVECLFVVLLVVYFAGGAPYIAVLVNVEYSVLCVHQWYICTLCGRIL